MQSGQSRASIVKLHYLSELERHIENTLLDYWVLRIEHSEDVNPVLTQWQQWENALYYVKEATPVIRGIQACLARYPTHNVRLFAEKASPRTRFIYPVYRTDGGTGSAQVLPRKWIPQASRFGAWLKQLETGALAGGGGMLWFLSRPWKGSTTSRSRWSTSP